MEKSKKVWRHRCWTWARAHSPPKSFFATLGAGSGLFPLQIKMLTVSCWSKLFPGWCFYQNSTTQKTLSFCLSQSPQGKTCRRSCYLQKWGKNISINSPDERVACTCFGGDSVWQVLSLLKSPCCLWKGVHQSSTCFSLVAATKQFESLLESSNMWAAFAHTHKHNIFLNCWTWKPRLNPEPEILNA